MYFDSFADFLAMGGHGLYVWLAYGVTLLTLLLWVLVQRSRRATLVADLRNRIRREEADK